jgi:hypothetical protein
MQPGCDVPRVRQRGQSLSRFRRESTRTPRPPLGRPHCLGQPASPRIESAFCSRPTIDYQLVVNDPNAVGTPVVCSSFFACSSARHRRVDQHIDEKSAPDWEELKAFAAGQSALDPVFADERLRRRRSRRSGSPPCPSRDPPSRANCRPSGRCGSLSNHSRSQQNGSGPRVGFADVRL